MYCVVIVARGRSLFPEHLVGRGVTTVNLAQVIGCTLLPMTTGVIAGAFAAPDGRAPELTYRLVFAFPAGTLAAGVIVYGRAREDTGNASQPAAIS